MVDNQTCYHCESKDVGVVRQGHYRKNETHDAQEMGDWYPPAYVCNECGREWYGV